MPKKIKQHPYLSPEACKLRERDGTPPWSIHVCEVDDFEPFDEILPLSFRAEVERAAELRAQIEADE
jgi:hypothetical protein